MIVDDPRYPDVRRTVGESVTASKRRPDGWTELTSHVDLDASGMLKEYTICEQCEGPIAGRQRVPGGQFRQPELFQAECHRFLVQPVDERHRES